MWWYAERRFSPLASIYLQRLVLIMNLSKGERPRKYRQSIALTQEENEIFTRFCTKHGMTKSYFARKSIFHAIDEYEKNQEKKKW